MKKILFFLFTFCIFFNLSSVFASELYKVRLNDEMSISEFNISSLHEYKYIYAVNAGFNTFVVGFNDLSHIYYEYNSEYSQLLVKWKRASLTSNDKACILTFITSTKQLTYTDKFEGGVGDDIGLVNLALESYIYPDYLFYNNFDIIFDGLETVPSQYSNLKLEYEYNEDYTKATIYAILEDGKYDDYIYYSLNGEDWIYKENTFTVEVTYNTEVFFKVEDNLGNIKYTNSVVIDKIKSLSDINFNVTFDFTPTDGSFMFTPILKSNLDRIFFKPIGDLNDFKITELNSKDAVDTEEYIELKNGVTYVVKETKYNIINGFLGGATNINPINLTLSFKILNPQNEEVYTKDYDCILHPYKNSSISGSNIFDGITENSSLIDIIDSVKSTIEIFKQCFLILPVWFWIMISTFLTVCIALRILGR